MIDTRKTTDAWKGVQDDLADVANVDGYLYREAAAEILALCRELDQARADAVTMDNRERFAVSPIPRELSARIDVYRKELETDE